MTQQNGARLGYSKECIARNLCCHMFIKEYIYESSFLSYLYEKPTRTRGKRGNKVTQNLKTTQDGDGRGVSWASPAPRRHPPSEAWEGVPRSCPAAARVGERTPHVGRPLEG